MRKNWLLFKGLSMEKILEIILENSKMSDQAMLYLLNIRLKRMLRSSYEKQKIWLKDEFEDTLHDFFIYLREGRNRVNIIRYEVLHRIRDRRKFESWLKRMFFFFLTNKSMAKEERETIRMDDREMTIGGRDDIEPFLNLERRILIASKVIAYIHQSSSNRNKILFFNWLMRYYMKKDCPHTIQELAELLGCSYLAARVNTHHIWKRMDRARTELMKTGDLPLDGTHIRMSEEINQNFSNLSPVLLKYYRASLFVETGIILDPPP